MFEHPRLIRKLEKPNAGYEKNVVEAFNDSDWAGCLGTRISTSGGVMTIASGLVKSWSGMQSMIALSSGEAEYYHMGASAEGIAINR